MTRIPVLVVGGYLGAGKTTFINHCLARGLRNAAIIVNDFGEINVDASIISERHGDTLELSNGCVCCSIGTTLADTLFTILDRPTLPEMIIVEASGVADPAAVAAYTHLQGLVAAGTIVLVDSVNAIDTAADPLLAATFERQVAAAHVVALTKPDIASAERVTATRDLVTRINSSAVVVAADAVSFSDLVVERIDTDQDPAPHTEPHDPVTSVFASHVHRFDSVPTLSELHDFLGSLPKNVVRAKGVIETVDGPVLIQKCGAHVAVTPSTLTPTGLVIITAG